MSMTKAPENSKKLVTEARLRKVKLKKNALDAVDIIQESKADPKFKTELCKSWIEMEFCIYGNKCRFAHGKSEIFVKPINNTKYKMKNCLSFFQTGYCNYGTRCHFKHDERKVSDIMLPYYSNRLLTKNYSYVFGNDTSIYSKTKSYNDNKRLKVFKNITKKGNKAVTFEESKDFSSSDSKRSIDSAVTTRILTQMC